MKKQIFTTAALIGAMIVSIKAQTYTETFESFSLPNNSFYKDTTGADWQTANAVFRYNWNNQWSYWSEGMAYTNVNDSTNGNYSNLYGCIAYKGYSNSNYYVTGQNYATIVLKSPYQIVDGFYITNTTYAAKVMKYGNSFSRAFGDTTGTGCGCPQGSYPDWFKVTIKGYKNGVMLNDSVEFYLADYRFSNNSLDYIVWNWQWVDCSSLGSVDSIQFFMYSSDVGPYGINTPTFFSIDNFTTSGTAGISSYSALNTKVFPNPVKDKLMIKISENGWYKIRVINILGNTLEEISVNGTIHQPIEILMTNYETGSYIVEISKDNLVEKHLIIKQ
ncbi:MAG: hypothetical protein KatS3mg027_1112 [Bacteroidia bacterium]|nr:MAG: hypothetical protein KatS3mg027_1112 [Bacteroidia bacterium]